MTHEYLEQPQAYCKVVFPASKVG